MPTGRSTLGCRAFIPRRTSILSHSNPIVDAPLIMHRGASAYAPENTLEALELAAEMKAKWIETDVRITADNQLVMLHDATVDRTTSGTGRLAQMTWQQLETLDAGSWFSDRFGHSRLARLSNYLETAQKHNLGVILEMKPDDGLDHALAMAVTREVSQVWTADPTRLVLSSFSQHCLRIALQALPLHPKCLAVLDCPDNPAETMQAAGADMIHLDHNRVSPTDLIALQAADLEFALATVNQAQRARDLLSQGANSVLTDTPDLLD